MASLFVVVVVAVVVIVVVGGFVGNIIFNIALKAVTLTPRKKSVNFAEVASIAMRQKA